MKDNMSASLNDLENNIESGLVAAHEYSNPEIFLPMNPVFRFIKKIFLFLIKIYTKYQIVFNYNILYSLNKLYQYLLHFESNYEGKEEINIKKINNLESRIKILENKFKKTR